MGANRGSKPGICTLGFGKQNCINIFHPEYISIKQLTAQTYVYKQIVVPMIYSPTDFVLVMLHKDNITL